MILFIAGLVLLAALSSCYVYFFVKRFLVEFLHIQFDRKRKVILHIILLVASMPAVNIFGIYAIVYYHLLVISMVLEVVNIVLKRFGWYRIGFSTGIFSVAIMVVMLVYGNYNIHQISETDYTVKSRKVQNLKIVQITDLHMGNAINHSNLAKYCEKISDLNADIVALTGDIVDERTSLEEMKEACEQLSNISNKMGIYYVYGNHDSASYSKNPKFTEADIQREFESHGVTVLKDQAVKIGQIVIAGRKDVGHYKNRLSSETLLENVDHDKYIILLDHQPLDIKKNAALGVDLQLSGHTHGGQLFPIREAQQLFTDTLVYGEEKIGEFTAITSSGISAWGYPLRTEGKSEYVVIDIK